MDPFQVRLRFVSALHRVNASLPSIQKALAALVDHAPTMHAELWDCIIDECRAGSINRRINLLFLIDAIFTEDTLAPAVRALFRRYLERDLYVLVDMAVPVGRWDALLNVPAVGKILAAWKVRLVVKRRLVEDLEVVLEMRKAELYALSEGRRNSTLLPPSDMQRRIEEDRERHKRLRERAWILPPTAFSHQSLFGTRPEQLDPTYLTRMQPASPSVGQADADGDRIWTTQDLDFAQMWEETSDFNDDDVEAIVEDQKLSWVNQPPPPPSQPPQVGQPTITPAPAHPAAAPAPTPLPSSQPPRAPASMRLAQHRPS